MGFFDSKRTTTNQTLNDVENTSIGVEDVDGTAIVGSGNSLTLTDFGAIGAAANLGRDALDLAGSSSAGALEFGAGVARSGFDVVRDTSADALSFAGDRSRAALEFADRAADRSTEFSSTLFDSSLASSADASRGALQFAASSLAFAGDRTRAGLEFSDRAAERADATTRSVFSTSLGALTDFFSAGQAQLGSTVTALNTIAREQSTSTDERVQDIAKSALKVGGLVAAAIAGVLVFSKVRS